MEVIKKYFADAIKADSLLDRAYLFLEDGDKKNALAYFERVLDQNPRSPFAYLGRMLAKLGVSDITKLELSEVSYTDEADFGKALRFSEGELHDALEQLSSARDDAESAYKKASEAEAKATDIEEFVEVYRLYEAAGNYADAKAKIQSIKEALSVLAYYSQQGFSAIMQQVESARARQAELNAMIVKFNSLISAQQTMQTTMTSEIAKREFELKGLGLFKKKRKLELMAEIEEGKKALTELEKSLASNKKQRGTVSAQLAESGAEISLASIFEIKTGGESVGKAEGVDAPKLDGVDLILFEDAEAPFRCLKRAGVLGVVAKNALALYALMTNAQIVEWITQSKTNAKAVGSSPALRRLAPLFISVIKGCKEMQDNLPVALRLAIQADSGDTVTFGYFTKDGKDPYRDIVPMPGTPYVRPGKPVEWYVIKKEKNLLTLIPTKPLTHRRFDPISRSDMTWKNCELREYMQGEMFDILFQGEEREIVVPMRAQINGTSVIDNIILPSHDEMLLICNKLPKSENYIWTRDSIEIDYYNSSWLVQPSIFSMERHSRWKQLVHNDAYLFPVVTVKIPTI